MRLTKRAEIYSTSTIEKSAHDVSFGHSCNSTCGNNLQYPHRRGQLEQSLVWGGPAGIIRTAPGGAAVMIWSAHGQRIMGVLTH